MTAPLTTDEWRLLNDHRATGFRYIGTFPAPEIITDLVRRGLLQRATPSAAVDYVVTDAGRDALKANPNY